MVAHATQEGHEFDGYQSMAMKKTETELEQLYILLYSELLITVTDKSTLKSSSCNSPTIL